MQSRTTRQFCGCFPTFQLTLNAMPSAHTASSESNPAHPSLQFKKLEAGDHIYSVRIGLAYRALAVMNKDRVVWYWIGSHDE